MTNTGTTMDPYRTNKLNHSILRVLGDLLQVAVKDPRVGFVTLNQVKLNRDHSVAEVYWSVLGDADERKTSFAGLKKARGFLQNRLGRTLGLRHAPELRFMYDDTVEKGMEIDGVLDGLAARGEFETAEERMRQLTLDDLTPPAELLDGLRAAQKVWVVPHHNPDPDAIGSALALAEALDNLDCEVRVVGYPDPPLGLSELPGYDRVTVCDEAERIFADEGPDTLVLVDCHRIDRTGPLQDVLDRFETRWCIDHHLVSGRKGPEPGWVEPRSCSTCTLIHRVVTALGMDPGPDRLPFDLSVSMATNIYAGLINDTGGFRFTNTHPLTFELARRLAACGVDTAWVSRTTMHRYRKQGIALLEKVLATFTYHQQGRILTVVADQAMLQETGGTLGDTEGFVNIATAVDGVERVAFIKELEPGVWRASLRVRGEGDVQQVAARHGGGGHKQASGCTLQGERDEVLATLVADLAGTLA